MVAIKITASLIGALYMAESHVISGLVTKHSELAGENKSHQQRIAELKTDLGRRHDRFMKKSIANGPAWRIGSKRCGMGCRLIEPVAYKSNVERESIRLLVAACKEHHGQLS